MLWLCLLFPIGLYSSRVDPCAELCNNDGPLLCPGGSWTKESGTCHGYVFRGDTSLGDYCYHSAETSASCPSSGEPVRPEDVGRLFDARAMNTLANVLSDFVYVEELCLYVDHLPGLISSVVGDSMHLSALDFWLQVNGSRLLDAAETTSSCQQGLVASLLTLVTEAPHALDDPSSFSSAIGFTLFCRENKELLRWLITRTPARWPNLPRFAPYLFNTVSLRRRAVATMIYTHQVEQGILNTSQGPCEPLGDVFTQRVGTDYYELDLKLPLTPQTRVELAGVGECIGLSLLYNAPIDRLLPQWFFGKLLNNRTTVSDVEADDPALYRTLRDAERGGAHVVRYSLRLNMDDPAPTVAEYVENQLAQLTPPESEERFVAIRQGLNSVAPIDRLVTIVSAADVKTLVLDDPGVPVDDLIAHSIIHTDDMHIVQWLWDWLRESPVATRRDFLNFVTGRTHLPLDGMAAMPRRISISVSTVQTARGDPNRFRLELPRYTSPAQLAADLVGVISP